MTLRHREIPALSPRERGFVDRLNASFAPPPMSAARRAALDGRVRERIERPRRHGRLAATLAATSAIAVASFWIGLPPVRVGPEPETAGSGGADTWEQRLFFGDVSETHLGEIEPGGSLPPEYAAIDTMFLER